MEGTNTVYTLENINKLANKIVNVQEVARNKAEGVAEFMLKYSDTNDINELLARIN